MNRLFFLFISILVLLGAISCDLLEEMIGGEAEVGETIIRSHTFQWYEGKVTHIKPSWDWAENAEVHSLERSAPDDGQGFMGVMWDKMSDFDDAGWELPGNVFTSGHRYVYRVRGHSEDGGFGPWSPDYTVTIPRFLPPANVKATLMDFKEDQNNADSYTVRIRITWDAVDIDGVKYKVYRSDTLDGYYEGLSIFAQSELIFEDYFSVNIPDPSTTVSRYYKVSSNYDEYGETEKSEAVVIDLKKVDGIDPGGTTGSWTDLNNGFSSQASSIDLVNHHDMLYALFVDEGNNNRLRAMSNNGADGASWSVAGDYLSLAAVAGDYACLYTDSNSLYVSYADTDDWLYVKQWDGMNWVAVGAEDGICVENENDPEDPPEYKDGTVPSLTVYNSQPFMVYRSTSFGLVESLYYPGSDTLWEETDCDYWTNGSIGASWIGLYVDDSNRPVAILQSGSDPELETHIYEGASWSSGNNYTLSTDPYMDIFDYLMDDSSIYVAYKSLNNQVYAYGLKHLSGGTASDTGFINKLDDMYGVKDISICRRSSGSGIIAAVSYMKNNNIYYAEVWDYDGSSWSQIGPGIQLDGIGSEIALALDSSNRPVIIYTDGAAVKAGGFRE